MDKICLLDDYSRIDNMNYLEFDKSEEEVLKVKMQRNNKNRSSIRIASNGTMYKHLHIVASIQLFKIIGQEVQKNPKLRKYNELSCNGPNCLYRLPDMQTVNRGSRFLVIHRYSDGDVDFNIKENDKEKGQFILYNKESIYSNDFVTGINYFLKVLENEIESRFCHPDIDKLHRELGYK